ncbi:MAG: DegV family protein [Flexilinea sp.]|jgi:DegV family protein with EDD domain
MAKIAIITDTDSSLPSQMAAEFGIRQVPIGIHFTGESYTTGIDIDDRRLFEKVDKLSCLPTTSAPNPADFINVFEAAFKQGSEAIVCICVSKEASSTYDSAATACGQFPERDIRIIDSLSMSMEQGFMALAAADAAKRDAGIDEIVARVEEIRKKMHTYAMLSTLKYLAMSGRASKFVTGLADTFNIKPILTIKEGKLDMLEKVRTRKKAIDRLLVLLDEAVKNKGIDRMAVIHTNDLQSAIEMETILRATFQCPEEIIIAELTPGLSVHTGAGVVGVVVQTM